MPVLPLIPRPTSPSAPGEPEPRTRPVRSSLIPSRQPGHTGSSGRCSTTFRRSIYRHEEAPDATWRTRRAARSTGRAKHLLGPLVTNLAQSLSVRSCLDALPSCTRKRTSPRATRRSWPAGGRVGVRIEAFPRPPMLPRHATQELLGIISFDAHCCRGGRSVTVRDGRAQG